MATYISGQVNSYYAHIFAYPEADKSRKADILLSSLSKKTPIISLLLYLNQSFTEVNSWFSILRKPHY